jgi:hypothetical protein
MIVVSRKRLDSSVNSVAANHCQNVRDQRLATIDEPHRPILSRVRWIALFSLFVGLARSQDAEVTADFLHKVVGDLTMTRHGGPLIERCISHHEWFPPSRTNSQP